ncbi:MAG: winged-helix domain-containing protein [Thermoplasmata archaeon]
MADDEELHDEIKSLKAQVKNLEHMLEHFMNLHSNVLSKLSTNSEIERKYIQMLSLYQRYGKVSPSLLPEINDSVSEGIVEILLSSGQPLNITQITERLRERRGSASRHTVRGRLERLEDKRIVRRVDDPHGKGYALTDEILDKWAKLLGIKI